MLDQLKMRFRDYCRKHHYTAPVIVLFFVSTLSLAGYLLLGFFPSLKAAQVPLIGDALGLFLLTVTAESFLAGVLLNIYAKVKLKAPGPLIAIHSKTAWALFVAAMVLFAIDTVTRLFTWDGRYMILPFLNFELRHLLTWSYAALLTAFALMVAAQKKRGADTPQG